MNAPNLIWFRDDLRLADNPALAAALADGPAVAVFIHETSDGPRPPGAAARWWLHRSLNALARDLASIGIPLRVETGDPVELLLRVAKKANSKSVYWNRRYAPGQVEHDKRVRLNLTDAGLSVSSFNARLLVEPWEIETGKSEPYRVFTPFWNALQKRTIPAPAAGHAINAEAIPTEVVDDCYAAPDWSEKLGKHWTPGEAAARAALEEFIENLVGYEENRDRPDRVSTSRLSPHLRFGEISPRQIWYALRHVIDADSALERDGMKFLSELAWREFCAHLSFQNSDIAEVPMRAKFAGMGWRNDRDSLDRWQRGQTGIPIVDAGMRELWETGYMHNRVRMITASFLTKNLLIDWREGERWFWDTLVDGDIASNPANWQWVAGCGADAAPFFRIFSPVLQGKKFDPQGDYVRRWVTEIVGLPDKYLHTPWAASEGVLADAGVEPGKSYPAQIVDLKASRERALEAFRRLK